MKRISDHIGLIKLAGLLVLFPLLIYSRVIARTVELNRTVRDQAVRIEAARADTMRKSPVPESFPKTDWVDGESVKTGTILHRIAPQLEQYGVSAERYTPFRLHREGVSELYAGELLLSGGFIALTRLLDELEKQEDGRIVSVSYRAVVLPQNRKKQLQMTVVFQQITQNQNP